MKTQKQRDAVDLPTYFMAVLIEWQILTCICWLSVSQLVKPTSYGASLIPGAACFALMELSDWMHRKIGNVFRGILLAAIVVSIFVWIARRA